MLHLAQTVNTLTGNKAGIMYKPRHRTEDDPQRRQPDILIPVSGSQSAQHILSVKSADGGQTDTAFPAL